MPNGKLLSKGDPMTEHEYSNHNQRTRAKFQSMINNKGVIADEFKTKKFAQRLLPKEWGNKGPTITITSLPDDFVHYEQARTPTVRECARMQTFPDWYKFAGKRTTGGIRRAGNPRQNIFDREVPKYTQIGNAVPVKLIKKLEYTLKNSNLIKINQILWFKITFKIFGRILNKYPWSLGAPFSLKCIRYSTVIICASINGIKKVGLGE